LGAIVTNQVTILNAIADGYGAGFVQITSWGRLRPFTAINGTGCRLPGGFSS
jgi:hypothetical protein